MARLTLKIGNPEIYVVVEYYYYPDFSEYRKQYGEHDATLVFKPQLVKPIVDRVVFLPLERSKNKNFILSHTAWQHIQMSIAEIPSVEYSAEDMLQAYYE